MLVQVNRRFSDVLELGESWIPVIHFLRFRRSGIQVNSGYWIQKIQMDQSSPE
jgi:hypothetical protein